MLFKDQLVVGNLPTWRANYSYRFSMAKDVRDPNPCAAQRSEANCNILLIVYPQSCYFKRSKYILNYQKVNLLPLFSLKIKKIAKTSDLKAGSLLLPMESKSTPPPFLNSRHSSNGYRYIFLSFFVIFSNV